MFRKANWRHPTPNRDRSTLIRLLPNRFIRGDRYGQYAQISPLMASHCHTAPRGSGGGIWRVLYGKRQIHPIAPSPPVAIRCLTPAPGHRVAPPSVGVACAADCPHQSGESSASCRFRDPCVDSSLVDTVGRHGWHPHSLDSPVRL
jgi:hypothetical protein